MCIVDKIEKERSQYPCQLPEYGSRIKGGLNVKDVTNGTKIQMSSFKSKISQSNKYIL